MKIEFLACWEFYNVKIANGRIVVIENDATNFNWRVMHVNNELKHYIEEAAAQYRPDDANRMRLVLEAFDELVERRPVTRFADTDVWEEDGKYYWTDDVTTKELTQQLDANYIGWDTGADEYVYFPNGLSADSVPLENYFL